MYKYEAHVPTEQFGYISVTIDGTAQEAVLAYKELSRVWSGGEGLPQKEWNDLIDSYRKTGTMTGDPGIIEEQMSTAQRWFINELKKSFARNK